MYSFEREKYLFLTRNDLVRTRKKSCSDEKKSRSNEKKISSCWTPSCTWWICLPPIRVFNTIHAYYKGLIVRLCFLQGRIVFFHVLSTLLFVFILRNHDYINDSYVHKGLNKYTSYLAWKVENNKLPLKLSHLRLYHTTENKIQVASAIVKSVDHLSFSHLN